MLLSEFNNIYKPPYQCDSYKYFDKNGIIIPNEIIPYINSDPEVLYYDFQIDYFETQIMLDVDFEKGIPINI